MAARRPAPGTPFSPVPPLPLFPTAADLGVVPPFPGREAHVHELREVERPDGRGRRDHEQKLEVVEQRHILRRSHRGAGRALQCWPGSGRRRGRWREVDALRLAKGAMQIAARCAPLFVLSVRVPLQHCLGSIRARTSIDVRELPSSFASGRHPRCSVRLCRLPSGVAVAERRAPRSPKVRRSTNRWLQMQMRCGLVAPHGT